MVFGQLTRALLATLVLVAGSTTALLANSGNSGSFAPASEFSEFTPADEFGRYVFMIEFDEPSLLDLHRQTRAEGERFNFRAGDIQDASALMTARQASYLTAMQGLVGRDLQPSHYFQVTHSGLAVRLTEREARQVAMLPDVASIQRERQYHIETFSGPEFIGAGSVWDGSTTPSGMPYRGEGIIASVLDTGIVANHPSFANDPSCGHGENGTPDKLISAVDCLSTGAGGVCNGTNPGDTNGHGTHVAGTVAGNLIGPDAVPPPNPPGGTTISGVAPCAHIRNYKVCPGQSCDGAAIQAAMNNIIMDGDVDTFNYSISGGTSPWADADRRMLDLVEEGVFVNASAGNTNTTFPNPVGQVNHRGPWVISVAASTRPGGAPDGVVSVTGPGTPPSNLVNVAVQPGSNSAIPGGVIEAEVRFDPDQPADADGCAGFPANFFDGAIALIHRGTCAFTQKINNAAAAGAIMVIIRNNQSGALSMGTSGQVNIPSYSMLQAPGNALRDFIAANPGATLRFEPDDSPQGDVLAGFSFRGPTPSPLQNLQKPDITAPGVGIYAADATTAGGPTYGSKSGTSMSGPHVSGAAALVRQMQPNWAPIEVGSAIRMTAKKSGFKENGSTSWDWDDVGSGRVELTRAGLAGMVMNETFANFMAANPSSGGDVRTLNLPSVRDLACTPSCTFTRTLRNTLDVPTSWSADFEVISGTFDVSISPSSFSFTGDLSETQTVTITVSPIGTIPLSFGTVDFVEAGGLSPDLHFTVAVAGQGEGGEPPSGVTGFNFEGTVSGITGDPEGVWASDLRMNVTAPAGATFDVGGFGGGAAPNGWDFDGSGSATDGTYTSSHPNAFFGGTDLEGNWTFEFVHTYAPGAAMTWDPIIIELTGPGRNVLAVIELDPFTLAGGTSTSFTIPVGDEPPETPPTISLDPEALNATVEQFGDSEDVNLNIANVGDEALVWSFADTTSVVGAMLRAGRTTNVRTAPAFGIDMGSLATSGLLPGETAYFDRSAPQSAVTISHSNSMSVTAGNTVACSPDGGVSTSINSFWRVFSLNDFGIATDFDVEEVSFGIENLSVSADIDVTLYTLDGAFVMANLTQIGSATASLGPQSLTVVNVPVSGSVPAGGTLAVEISGPDLTGVGAFFAGSNAAGETAPSYIQSSACGLAEPTTFAGIGFANVHLVMEVTGSAPIACTEPADISWLAVSDLGGTVAGQDSQDVTVTFDGTGLAQGLYEDNLCIESNDPANALVVLPTALTVGPPASLPPAAAVDPESLALSLVEGTGASLPLTLFNDGEDPLDWSVFPAISSCASPAFVPWLSVAPTMGTVPGEDSAALTVGLNALGQSPGVYEALICISSNDPVNPVLPVPVTMTVAEAGTPAFVQVVHLAPFAAGGPATAVDVVINGDVALPGVEYGDSTAYLTLPAGNVDIDIVPDGATEPAISASAFLQPGFNYTVIANGDGVNQALGLALLEDDISAPASGNFKLRLGHLAPFAAGSASAEVRLADGTLIQAVDFGDITGFLELPAGAYDLIITSPGGAAVLIDPVEVSFNDGDIVSAFAAGDGGNQDLGVFALPSDAAGFFLVLNTIDPEAAFNPGSFAFDLVRGETDQAVLEISNLGSSVLSWFIDTDVPGGPVGTDLDFTALDTGVAELVGFSEFTAPILSRGFDREMGSRADDVVGDSVIRALPRAPIIGDWSEGFESVAGLFTQGWAAQNNSSPLGTGNWTQGNPAVFNAHSGPDESYALVNFSSGAGAATLSNWLIAPEMELQNGTEISFYTRSPASPWEDRLQVRMSTAGDSTDVGTTATSVGDFTELLLDINPTYAAGGYPTVWTQYTITISGLSEPTTGRIAFRYFVEDGGPSGTNSDLIGVDTLEITQPVPPPTCAEPTAISWLSLDQNSGFTPSGETSEVTLSVDSTGLAAGTYEAVLCVNSNDAAQPLVELPVTLDVEGLPIADIAPESLDFVVEQGATADDDLIIGNLGDGPMLWSLIDAVISGTSDILYNSGPLVTNPGAGAGGADVSALQTAIGLDVFGAGVQQGAGNRMADAFEVDGSWTIDDMTFFVYQTGSTTTSTITSVSLRIWDGAPNDPASNVIFGDTTTNRLLSTQFSGIYRALDTALTNTQRPIMEVVADLGGLELEAGTYWVDVSFGGSLASGPWMPPISIPGEITTGTDSYQLTGGVWNPWVDTGTTTRQGMAFIVRGEALPCWAPGEPSWLSVTPVDGSVGAESSVLAAVNVDVDGLAVGSYVSKLCVATNDAANAFVEVPVNLEVIFTADVGFLEGNVQSLGYCGENPFAAEGASIVVDGALGGEFSTTADENGDYFLSISDTESPVTVTFSAPDHLNQVVMSVDIVGGETTILDANLVLDAGCADTTPTSFAETVSFGATGSFALTIDNSSGGGDLGWDVETEDVIDSIGARDGHEPLLDETLSIPNFSIDSTANGGSPAVFTIPAGVLTRGDVIGFSFEGTVAGITGNSSWASDMCLRVQAPDGSIYDVGGFSSAIPGCAVNAWDFDGSGSTNDGTYSSEHFDAFDPAVGDEGDWTFTFTNGWNSTAAATMDWTDVTITLHKQALPACTDPLGSSWLSVTPASGIAVAGGSSAVDVLVDTDGLASGIYAASICINTDDAQRPLIVVPFELTVEPANPVTITGQVNSLGYCSNESNAVEGALIEVLGDSGEVFTTTTDGDGIYSIVIGEAESPVTVSASAPDHITGVESGVVLVSPGSVDVDFDLVLEAACATVDPTSFADSVSVAEQKDYNLTIGNIDGAADLNWSIDFEEVMSGQLGQRGALVPYSYRLPGAGELPRVTGASRSSGPVEGAEAAHLVAPGIQSAAISAVVEEGFDDVAALPGAGWALQNNSDPLGTSSWFQGNPDTFPAHQGAPNAYIGANFNNTSGGTGVISNWLMTPEVALENGTELRFWSRSTGDGFADRLEVRLSTSGDSVNVGTAATDVGDFDTVLLTINESLDPFGYPDEWTEYVVTVSGLSAPTSGRFGLRYFVTGAGPSGANSDFIGIDTLSITQPSGPPAACDDPQGVAWLSVDSSSGMVAAGASSDVVVTVDGTQLAEGTNEALICVLTDDVQASVLTVPITIERIELDPAVIVVDPLVLATTLADGDTDDQSLSITNDGEFPLSWEIDSTSAGCELPAWVGAVDPLSGTLGEDASEDVTVTFDATGLVPDVYEATLCITSNDPATPLVEVALELTVVETMATIEGFVSSLGYCSDNPAPAAGAGILVEGVEGVYSTTADGSGFYQIMIPADDSPVTITATAIDHLDGTESGVVLVAGEVTDIDFDLVLEAACATVAPASIEFVLVEGTGSEELSIGNINGAASLTWFLDSGLGCYDEGLDTWLSLSSDGDAIAAGGAQTVDVVADASGLTPGLYQVNLCIATSDSEADSFVVPVELDVRTDGIFQDRFEDNDD